MDSMCKDCVFGDLPYGRCSFNDSPHTIRNSELEVINCDGYTPKEPSKTNHPDHYNFGKVECIDAIESALSPEEFEGFCKGNIIKYVWRANHKGGAEDLQKAVWYADRLINRGIEDV